MKKSLLFAVVAAFALVACGKNEPAKSSAPATSPSSSSPASPSSPASGTTGSPSSGAASSPSAPMNEKKDEKK